MRSNKSEVYTSYYDIFTTNAFGPYFKILKEVAYNDIMSTWLSYFGNLSQQHQIERTGEPVSPDENFAREIMQLFSIGLYQLNDDGTSKYDPVTGDPFQTYSQMDIMNMARVWTGFTRAHNGRYNRGNSESRGAWQNQVDPLIISRNKHDRFPKSDLLGGYIGDGHPLCADLPDRDHLRCWRIAVRHSK